MGFVSTLVLPPLSVMPARIWHDATAGDLLFNIAVTLHLPLPIAIIVAVFTEMMMGGYGVGAAMITAAGFADSRGVFAGIVEIAVVGYIAVKAMALLRRRRVLAWHLESASG